MTTMETELVQQPSAVVPRATTPMPWTRLVRVELRKMFDTRSGFWLMASILISAMASTVAVVLFAPDSDQIYSSFATAVGFPMAVILPMIAILSVTSEWTQRSGLMTFTLVPHRGRVIKAKAAAIVSVGIVSMLVAFGIGALGNVLATTVAGTHPVWDASFSDVLCIVLGNVLGLLSGLTLGVLIRGSSAAIVAYFIYSLLLPNLSSLLASSQGWFRQLQPWVDISYAQTVLFDFTGAPTGAQWAQLAVTGAMWLLVPLVIGVRLAVRSEVK